MTGDPTELTAAAALSHAPTGTEDAFRASADPARPLAGIDNGRILDELNDAVVAADDSNRIVYCNPAAERLLGWRRAELVGQPLPKIIPPRLHDAHVAGFARYLDGHEPRLIGRSVRVPALRADGSELEVELSLSAYHPGEGRHIFVASLRDLSERVELERALAVSSYLRATTEVAVRLGLSGEADSLKEAAPLVLEALGNSLGWDLGAFWMVRREVAEVRCVEVWRAPHLPDAGFEEATRQSRFARGVGLPGQVWATGKAVWVADVTKAANFPRAAAAAVQGLHGYFAFPVLSGTTVLGVVEFFSDEVRQADPDLLDVVAAVGRQLGQFIERKRAEEAARFRAALLASEAEASIDGLVAVSPSGEVLFWNQRLLDMLGVEAELVRQASSDDLVALVLPLLVDRDAFVALVSDLRRDLSKRARTELTLVDGRSLECYSSPLGGDDGTHYGRAWYFRDITEHKLAERRFASLAGTLQASLLPPHPPDIPGMEVATRYRAARLSSTAGMEVGGDFYDLFPVKGTSWGFAIGDVCGKGAEAAALTALARYTIRAAAMRVRRSSQVLSTLNEAVLRDDNQHRFLTVVAGFLRPRPSGAEVVLASGGHPLPVVLRADGRVEQVGRHGTLIGVFARPQLLDTRVYLAHGDAIVLYTDGVTEARGSAGMLEDAGLAAVLASAVGSSADALADRVLDAVLEVSDGEPRDDVALVVLRVPPAPATGTPGAGAPAGS